MHEKWLKQVPTARDKGIELLVFMLGSGTHCELATSAGIRRDTLRSQAKASTS
jgi:hypothetical protein